MRIGEYPGTSYLLMMRNADDSDGSDWSSPVEYPPQLEEPFVTPHVEPFVEPLAYHPAEAAAATLHENIIPVDTHEDKPEMIWVNAGKDGYYQMAAPTPTTTVLLHNEGPVSLEQWVNNQSVVSIETKAWHDVPIYSHGKDGPSIVGYTREYGVTDVAAHGVEAQQETLASTGIVDPIAAETYLEAHRTYQVTSTELVGGWDGTMTTSTSTVSRDEFINDNLVHVYYGVAQGNITVAPNEFHQLIATEGTYGPITAAEFHALSPQVQAWAQEHPKEFMASLIANTHTGETVQDQTGAYGDKGDDILAIGVPGGWSNPAGIAIDPRTNTLDFSNAGYIPHPPSSFGGILSIVAVAALSCVVGPAALAMAEGIVGATGLAAVASAEIVAFSTAVVEGAITSVINGAVSSAITGQEFHFDPLSVVTGAALGSSGFNIVGNVSSSLAPLADTIGTGGQLVTNLVGTEVSHAVGAVVMGRSFDLGSDLRSSVINSAVNSGVNTVVEDAKANIAWEEQANADQAVLAQLEKDQAAGLIGQLPATYAQTSAELANLAENIDGTFKSTSIRADGDGGHSYEFVNHDGSVVTYHPTTVDQTPVAEVSVTSTPTEMASIITLENNRTIDQTITRSEPNKDGGYDVSVEKYTNRPGEGLQLRDTATGNFTTTGDGLNNTTLSTTNSVTTRDGQTASSITHETIHDGTATGAMTIVGPNGEFWDGDVNTTDATKEYQNAIQAEVQKDAAINGDEWLPTLEPGSFPQADGASIDRTPVYGPASTTTPQQLAVDNVSTAVSTPTFNTYNQAHAYYMAHPELLDAKGNYSWNGQSYKAANADQTYTPAAISAAATYLNKAPSSVTSADMQGFIVSTSQVTRDDSGPGRGYGYDPSKDLPTYIFTSSSATVNNNLPTTQTPTAMETDSANTSTSLVDRATNLVINTLGSAGQVINAFVPGTDSNAAFTNTLVNAGQAGVKLVTNAYDYYTSSNTNVAADVRAAASSLYSSTQNVTLPGAINFVVANTTDKAGTFISTSANTPFQQFDTIQGAGNLALAAVDLANIPLLATGAVAVARATGSAASSATDLATGALIRASDVVAGDVSGVAATTGARIESISATATDSAAIKTTGTTVDNSFTFAETGTSGQYTIVKQVESTGAAKVAGGNDFGAVYHGTNSTDTIETLSLRVEQGNAGKYGGGNSAVYVTPNYETAANIFTDTSAVYVGNLSEANLLRANRTVSANTVTDVLRTAGYGDRDIQAVLKTNPTLTGDQLYTELTKHFDGAKIQTNQTLLRAGYDGVLYSDPKGAPLIASFKEIPVTLVNPAQVGATEVVAAASTAITSSAAAKTGTLIKASEPLEGLSLVDPMETTAKESINGAKGKG